MKQSLKDDRFTLKQTHGEQWVPEEVVTHAWRLCDLTRCSVHILFGLYDNGAPIAGATPRWFHVYPGDTLEECQEAYAAGKDHVSGISGVGEDVHDDDPQPIGYISAEAKAALGAGFKAIMRPARDDLYCVPVYDCFKSRY